MRSTTISQNALRVNEPAPYKDGAAIKAGTTRYSEEFLCAMGDMAQYIYDTHGRFPATVPTMYMRAYTQAHHLETEFHDRHFGPGAYLQSHAGHMQRWHGK